MWKKLEFLILIIIIGMKGFVQGSCLEYGHSCWGAHGKRSDKSALPKSGSIENIKFNQDSKNLISDGSTPERYILLKILLNKDSFDNNDEILKNSDNSIASEIDHRKLPESTRNWNLKKFPSSLRKHMYLRTTTSDNQQLPIKSRIQQNPDLKDGSVFDPYVFLRKSSKPTTAEKSHYLQSDIYSDEDQNLEDFPLN